jgi:Family of unknown function (DUF5675)
MTTLTLTRVYQRVATTGLLTIDGLTYSTVELPWQDNTPDVSCVPEGVYDLIPYDSPKHGPTWYLENATWDVGGKGAARSFCELHAANFARQLEGCIAAGLMGDPMYDPVSGIVTPAVEESQPAIKQILADLGPMSTGHKLIITSASGPPTE